ncbi:phosphoglycerate kinase [Chloroflexota bacterium]
MNKQTVRDIDVAGKRVLVRVDFNVPMDEKASVITDDSRMRATLPTIRYLIEQNAKVILISHLGRPKGKVVDELKQTVLAQRLSKILGQQVGMTADCIGAEVEKSVDSLHNGEVILLENLRFHPEEEQGSTSFAQALARLGDVFVNDAFGTSHRAHASISGIANYLPSVAGLLLEKEVDTLGSILGNPIHPFAALLGGAKVSDKIGMLENILTKVDAFIIGGGMAATFLKAKALEVGLSLIEDELEFAKKLINNTSHSGSILLLPVDVVVTEEDANQTNTQVVFVENIPPRSKIVDIGPQTIMKYCTELQRCKTVFWNGPMGIYEKPASAEGTKALANCLAQLDGTTIIGGGSTADAITEMQLADKMSFVSTGGGASLEFLGGATLPGIEALLDKER